MRPAAPGPSRSAPARSAPTLLLLNGAPGSGKSTLAALLAAERPGALSLDIDGIKHSLGGWEEGLTASGRQARRLALAMAGRQLADGFDVVIGQYLARTEFLEELEQLAAEHGARFVDAVLVLDERTLRTRLAGRRERPDRPEQAANDCHVRPEDAPALIRAIEGMFAQRPHARRIAADGAVPEVLEALRGLLPDP